MAEAVLPKRARRAEVWSSARTLRLAEERERARVQGLTERVKGLSRKLRASARVDRERWWKELAKEMEGAMEKRD